MCICVIYRRKKDAARLNIFFQQQLAKYNQNINELKIKLDTKETSQKKDQDIRNNSDITQTITPKFIENEHISSDIIAPLSEGYFDLIIDHTSADVSFEYEIATTVNETSSVQDIITTGYSINGGEITELTEENKIIKSEIIFFIRNFLLIDAIF